jgi:hypothetical protein
MSTATKWQNSSANPCGPIQAKRFNSAWGKLRWENNTFTELTGIVGVSERSSTLTAMCIGGGGEERSDVAAAKARIGEQFAWTITRENVNAVLAMIDAELVKLQANRPVKDKREQPDEAARRAAEYEKTRAEQAKREKQQSDAFVSLYGSGQSVTVQPGQMAVTARVCYDNSDLMSDYFDRHASLSQRFALLVVPKQAETERLARLAVSKYPQLAALPFEWHTEKYSMGHGNYLEDGGFELPPELSGIRNYYGGGGAVNHGHWEIEFEAAYRDNKVMPTFKGYGGEPVPASQPQPGDAEYEALRAKVAALEAQRQAKVDVETCSTEELEAAGELYDKVTQATT